MINTELIKECLDAIDLKYTELDDGGIAVTFYDEEFFPYQVVTFIRVADDRLLTFSTRAVDFPPRRRPPGHVQPPQLPLPCPLRHTSTSTATS